MIIYKKNQYNLLKTARVVIKSLPLYTREPTSQHYNNNSKDGKF
jgi:hypothetical protein